MAWLVLSSRTDAAVWVTLLRAAPSAVDCGCGPGLPSLTTKPASVLQGTSSGVRTASLAPQIGQEPFPPSSRLHAGEHRVLVLARFVPSLTHLETDFARNAPPCLDSEEAHRPVIGFNPKASLVADEILSR